MRLPTGELADVQAIDAAQAVRGDKDALTALSRAYEGVDVLVARAEVSGSGAQRTVALNAVRYAAGYPDQTWTGSVKAEGNEAEDALFARAVAAVVTGVNDAWKQSMLAHGGDSNASASLVATVPLTSLKDWVTVRERLRSVSSIQRMRLLSLSKDAARIEIGYLGEPETLQIVLAQRDLMLVRGEPDWTLSAKGARTQ
jgi:hypothetical protein